MCLLPWCTGPILAVGLAELMCTRWWRPNRNRRSKRHRRFWHTCKRRSTFMEEPCKKAQDRQRIQVYSPALRVRIWALGGPTWAGGLDQTTSRSPFQPQPFCDSIRKDRFLVNYRSRYEKEQIVKRKQIVVGNFPPKSDSKKTRMNKQTLQFNLGYW